MARGFAVDYGILQTLSGDCLVPGTNLGAAQGWPGTSKRNRRNSFSAPTKLRTVALARRALDRSFSVRRNSACDIELRHACNLSLTSEEVLKI